MRYISLFGLLIFGAIAGMGQTLTCTFQFAGSGTLDTHTFTNAAITITTVGDTNNRHPSGIGAYYLNNTSASITITGIGTFQFRTPYGIGAFSVPSNTPPGTVLTQYFTFGSDSGALIVGISSTTNPWSMLSSIDTVILNYGGITWSPVATSGGTLNLYNTTTSIPMTFQATLTGTPPTPVLTRSGVLSHIAAGGGWTTVMTLANTTATAVPVTVALHNDDGSALSLPVTTTQQGVSHTTTTSSVSATINPNATLLISTGDEVASTVVGWADVLSTGTLGGFAIFRLTPQKGSPSEGTVPLQSQYSSTITLPYDNTVGFVMGVALANLSASLAGVTVTMWDDGGNQLGTQFISIAGSGHTAFVLPNQFPQTVGKRGIVKFQADGGLAGLGLRFSPFGTFTSVPTM